MPPHNTPNHHDLRETTGTSEKRIPSTPGTHGGRLQKCRSPFFSSHFIPTAKPETAPALLTAYKLAAGPRELQGHHLMAEPFLRPRGCRV